jgi:DNA-binding GntR family transcriptional regulator
MNTTLRDKVVHDLREAIVSGHFTPGRRLVERQMCELLGVSRTLVREALRQLEAEGWVCNLPYRGPIVATMTPQEVRELYEVRAALEGMAALLFVERANPGHLARLTSVVDTMTAAHKRGDQSSHREQVHVFYEILREAAGNTLLRTQLATMSARMAWLRRFTLARPERAEIAVKEEAALLKALKARNGALARQLCEIHMQKAGEAAVAALAAHDAALAEGEA